MLKTFNKRVFSISIRPKEAMHLILNKFYFFKKKSNNSGVILLNTIPKAGTNLLLNIIKNIPKINYKNDLSDAASIVSDTDRLEYVKKKIIDFSDGSLYVGHIPYAKCISEWFKEKNIKVIFLYRDPRSVTVSLYHYVMRDSYPRHKYFSLYSSFSTDNERLKAIITGYGKGEFSYFLSENSIPSIRFVYEVYKQWFESPFVLSLKFENFVSKDYKLAVDQVLNIMKFIDIDSSYEEAEKIFLLGSNPEISRTFRTGKVDSWRREYNEEHFMLFKQRAGNILSVFGYDE